MPIDPSDFLHDNPDYSMGPLRANPANPRYFLDGRNRPVLLCGSHTWNSFQDTDTSSTPAAVDFPALVRFLLQHGHNCTILWKKDLPTYFNWGAGGTWQMTPHPWPRTGPGNASDGLLKFDLTQFNQAYFDRLRTRVQALLNLRIYAIVELFDGLGLHNNRGGGDGYPFSSGNNINSIADDGAESSMTMGSANAITAVQDAYVKHVIDITNPYPNVIYEISEEAPSGSGTWWAGHMIDLIHTYEAGKPYQHPVLYPTLQPLADDTGLTNSNADLIAPAARTVATSYSGSGTPANKVAVNDSDHSYFNMWLDTALQNRNYVWENICNGGSLIFMDPYLINWSGRNAPGNVTNGVGTTPDTRWDNLRDNLGQVAAYGRRISLNVMTPQSALASTTWCLGLAGVEYLVYAPSSGAFTVDLSAGSGKTYTVEWFDPVAITITHSANQAGGSSTQSFTPPGGFTADAVLYLKVQ